MTYNHDNLGAVGLAGYNLTASDITDAYHSEDELWSAINPVFQTKSRNSTSYKYCFLKAILDNIFNVNADLVLPFYVVFERFTEIYWNLIIKFRLAAAQLLWRTR